jgi:hypothetical protein
VSVGLGVVMLTFATLCTTVNIDGHNRAPEFGDQCSTAAVLPFLFIASLLPPLTLGLWVAAKRAGSRRRRVDGLRGYRVEERLCLARPGTGLAQAKSSSKGAQWCMRATGLVIFALLVACPLAALVSPMASAVVASVLCACLAERLFHLFRAPCATRADRSYFRTVGGRVNLLQYTTRRGLFGYGQGIMVVLAFFVAVCFAGFFALLAAWHAGVVEWPVVLAPAWAALSSAVLTPPALMYVKETREAGWNMAIFRRESFPSFGAACLLSSPFWVMFALLSRATEPDFQWTFAMMPLIIVLGLVALSLLRACRPWRRTGRPVGRWANQPNPLLLRCARCETNAFLSVNALGLAPQRPAARLAFHGTLPINFVLQGARMRPSGLLLRALERDVDGRFEFKCDGCGCEDAAQLLMSHRLVELV